MIAIKSNVDDIIKSFSKWRNAVALSIDNIAERLVQQMSEDMKSEIEAHRSTWLQPNGNLEKVNVSSIDFKITKISNSEVRVTIGDSLKKIKVGNTVYSLPHNQHYEYINPMYFIEFGWGVIGEYNPKKGSTKYDWEYNTNEHGRITENPFYFKGLDGTRMETQGRKGINFMYNVIEKYRTKWYEVLLSLVGENMNNA